MTNFYMLIGVPASGKSTFLQKRGIPNANSMVVSSDYHIDNYASLCNRTYNSVFKEYVKTAHKLMYQDLKFGLDNKLDIYWDQTNLTVKSRKDKLVKIPDDYRKIAVYFVNPTQHEHKRRLASRPGKTIPQNILDNMLESIQYPTYDEGFDEIWFVKPDGDYLVHVR